jgi:hypothetical protein
MYFHFSPRKNKQEEEGEEGEEARTKNILMKLIQ